MEEYTQLSMDTGQYQAAKKAIKMDLAGIVKSFVRVGWQLWRISRTEAFRQDGYKTMAEFGKAEYGMTPSGVSRFIEVYEKYSVDGDTPELRAEYRDYNFSQLTEMLQITEEDRQMFLPEAKRESIRDFKKFTQENENSPDALLNWMKEPEDDEGKAIRELFRQNRDLMNEFFGSRAYAEKADKELAEILNPSGNMHFRHRTVFMMFYDYEKGIMINRFGQSPQPMKWETFLDKVRELFEDVPGSITWKKCFGEPEIPAGNETVETEPEEKDLPDEQIEGQDTIENHPEFMPAPEIEPVPDEIGPERIIAPAQKKEQTEEQKYNSEQARIDRETKKKLQEMEDEEKMEHLPSDDGPKVHSIKLASNYYNDVVSGRKSFELRKNDRGYREGHKLELLEFADGRHTGRVIRADIVYMLEDYTGLEEGFCILGIRVTEFD